MIRDSNKPSGLLFSAAMSGVVFAALVALVYSAFNSDPFRQFFANYWQIAWSFCFDNFNSLIENITVPPLAVYVLVGAFYWIEWTMADAQLKKVSARIMGRLVKLQRCVVWLTVIFAVQHLYTTSMPMLSTIVLFLHFFVVFGLTKESSKKLQAMSDQEEAVAKVSGARNNVDYI